MKLASNVRELIGNTPIIRINSISECCGANVLGKCEFLNPTGSVKDRIAYYMVKKALASGDITKRTTIVEPTSGNTGIALASLCSSLGIELILTMPESMSVERRKLLKAYGARIELTPAEQGMGGALRRAYELKDEIKDAHILQQFENPINPQAHKETTAKEIVDALGDKVDIFIAGVGTGGTISGVGEVLKEVNPNTKVYAVEPDESPVLSGGKPAPHKIQGIGAGFVPKTFNRDICDGIIRVSGKDALEQSRKVALTEGLLVGISSGANLFGAMSLAKRSENRNKTILTMLCDIGERYLSTNLFGSEEGG
eukprot:TRINITY_DN120433_c0_g1_i1.p2 TRINITY_DN120433_c0_g1~~TRINITY_DN120433_c0_g1_i1.p2  ORF type:complete len:312 (+),score=28.51 TRINITY_DN120433_c0_g1_i1:3617-4552(+)